MNGPIIASLLMLFAMVGVGFRIMYVWGREDGLMKGYVEGFNRALHLMRLDPEGLVEEIVAEITKVSNDLR